MNRLLNMLVLLIVFAVCACGDSSQAEKEAAVRLEAMRAEAARLEAMRQEVVRAQQ